MYLLLGLSILLAALLSFNSLATLMASLVWRLLGRWAQHWPARTQATTLFLLRVAPVAAGVACLVLLVLPSYVAHEPRSTNENIGYKLALLALVSAGGISLALIRGLASWRATTRLTADWLSQARLISLPGVEIPCYQIKHPFPVIAIVGTLRPRLFIASHVFEKLEPGEMVGAIHHEVGHLNAQDNLKRGLLRACRNVLLIIPCGRRLDHDWAEVSESAADEHAAKRGGRVALDLASALVKIARMIPSGACPAMPAGVFLVGDEPGGIRARVKRLVQLAGAADKTAGWRWSIPKRLLWLSAVAFALIFALSATHTHMLASVHSVIEHAVYFLE
jgi:Zn-dependent protease with chaperone function